MSDARCDVPGKMKLLIRFGLDGQQWLDALTEQHVGYSLGQSVWDLQDATRPRLRARVHTAFVGRSVSVALVTDVSGELCDVARSHHTCCTRISNKLHARLRGTVWDNRGLIVREVVGWEGALQAIAQIAGWAALQTGTNDPYRCPRFFGPRRWGTTATYAIPDVLDKRSTLPDEVVLTLVEPDERPPQLSRVQLIHEAEAAIDRGVADLYREQQRRPRNVRPFRARKHAPNPPPPMCDEPNFIGTAELVQPAAEEARKWLQYYRQCRDEFREDQYVAFPAGTIRFRRLGAACDPLPTYNISPPPPGSRRVTHPPPRFLSGSKRGPPQ